MNLTGMDPAELDQWVEIREKTGQARDAGGGQSDPSWTAIATDPYEYVKIEALRARQRKKDAKKGAPPELRVVMRYRSDVDTRNRLYWDDRGATRILELLSGPVDPMMTAEFIVFEARIDRS